MEICPKCGLPKQACVCEQIAKGSQKIKITTDKKKFGKIVTIVTGFDAGIDVKQVAKSLKNELACGGTYKDEKIELQGNHVKKTKIILVKLGFDEESIT
jgi:translation initiation factor 1